MKLPFMKIGGKYLKDTTVSFAMLTYTNGYMNVDGSVQSSTSYKYSQKLSVAEGDKINLVLVSNHNTIMSIRAITAFNGNVATSSAGWNNNATTLDSYVVPSGIDGIVITMGQTGDFDARIETEDALAKAMSVSQDGSVITEKKWQSDKITVIEQTGIASADAFTADTLDLAEYGIISLRVNYLMPDADTTIVLRGDLNPNGTTWLFNLDGSAVSFALPATSQEKIVIITPDDFNILSYLRYLRLRIQPNAVPSSDGFIKIYAIVKR